MSESENSDEDERELEARLYGQLHQNEQRYFDDDFTMPEFTMVNPRDVEMIWHCPEDVLAEINKIDRNENESVAVSPDDESAEAMQTAEAAVDEDLDMSLLRPKNEHEMAVFLAYNKDTAQAEAETVSVPAAADANKMAAIVEQQNAVGAQDDATATVVAHNAKQRRGTFVLAMDAPNSMAEIVSPNGETPRQSSKKSVGKRTATRALTNGKKANEQPNKVVTVYLDDSSTDSDDDVVFVPSAPREIITVLDSDEEPEDYAVKKPKVDVSTAAATASPSAETFAKPLLNSALDTSVAETPSRCISPASVLSTDDFIAQKDQNRLLQRSRVHFDDEVLLSATDGDSLLEIPTNTAPNNRAYQSATAHVVSDAEHEVQDVYDDEEDSDSNIIESVYTKAGAERRTIIRSIESSSDDEAADSLPAMPKKPVSSKRKHSNNNNNNNKGRGVHGTNLAFIAKGPAIENYGIDEAEALATGTTVCEMSDGEFLAQLNSYARGDTANNLQIESVVGNYVDENAEDEEEDQNNVDELPTARAIVEKVLSAANVPSALAETASTNNAMPDNLLEECANMFAEIDTMFAPSRKRRLSNCYNSSDEDSADNSQQQVAESEPQPQVKAEVANVQVVDGEEPVHVDDDVDVDDDVQIVENAEDAGIKMYTVALQQNADTYNAGIGWFDEMTSFYNKSWKGENFQLKKTLSTLDRDEKLWRINREDKLEAKRTQFRMKCYNCCEFGHTRAKCTKPKRPLICSICGESGHRDVRCPNTVCLRCGNKTHTFTKSCNACTFHNHQTCVICKLKGHTHDICPDRWRRYHSTTEVNGTPSSDVTYNKRRYCSNCGKAGHLSDTCLTVNRFVEYPPISSRIQSFSKSYKDDVVPFRQEPLLVSLLSKPNTEDNMMFTMLRPDGYYGRFLKAVGLKEFIPDRKIIYEKQQAAKKTGAVANAPMQTQGNATIGNSEVAKVQQAQHLDSDSNYSFSEHFEDNDDNDDNTPNVPAADYIHLNTIDDDMGEEDVGANQIENQLQLNVTNPLALTGISQRFMSAESPEFVDNVSDDNEETEQNRSLNNDSDEFESGVDAEPVDSLNNVMSSAQIHISKVNRAYLCTDVGANFLKTVSSRYNVRADITLGSHGGYFLDIHGTRTAQDQFYAVLLEKLRNLPKKETLQKVPKRAQPLIRTLQENIALLTTNLGQPYKLHKHIKYLEKSNTKLNMKMADKNRRVLNMILLGKAGLCNGQVHLDNLLSSLKTIITKYKDDDMVPSELRDSIDEHFKVIFTSYRHDNYDKLLLEYAEIVKKNLMPTMNFDPNLINAAAKKQQKTALSSSEQPKQSKRSTFTATATATGTATATAAVSSSPDKQHHHVLNPVSFARNKGKLLNAPPPPRFSYLENPSGDILQDWLKACDNTINTIYNNVLKQSSDSGVLVSRPSKYWSREAMKILRQCLALTETHARLHDKLQILVEQAYNRMFSCKNCHELHHLSRLLRNGPNTN